MLTNRRTAAGVEVLLFPFFDLMVCTLGVLTLLAGSIVSLSLETTGITITNANIEAIRGETQKEPLYIEWTGHGLIVYPSLIQIPIAISPSSDPGFDIARIEQDLQLQIRQSAFASALQCLRQNQQSRYLVVLVRPSGFNTFLAFRDIIIQSGIDIGYEPVGEHWKIASASEPCL